MRILRLISALFILSCLLVGPSTARSDPKPEWQVKPDKGFIDDPLAFSKDGSLLGYIHTDAATFTRVVTVKVGEGFKPASEASLESPTLVPRQLLFSPDNKRLTLLWSDGDKGTQGLTVFDVSNGAVLRRLGPATVAEFTLVGGEQAAALVTEKPDKAGGVALSVEVVRLSDGKRLGQYKALLQADQTFKTPPIRLLQWDPGRITVLGMRKGVYDKKRDYRLPDQAVRHDFLAKKDLWAEAPRDLVQWNQALNMRQNHPGQLRFLEVSESRAELFLSDEKNNLQDLRSQLPWTTYDTDSLQQRETLDGQLYFSMTVDPMNPEAEKRKKEDPERMDLYQVVEGGKVKLIGQVVTGRPRGAPQAVRFIWQVGEGRFAYLHKLKGFARGGKELSVYPLTQAK